MYEFEIAFRYIFSRKRKSIVSFMGFISILGIGVGVACLIAVIAVMNGFSNELEKRIIGQSPHIIVECQRGIDRQSYQGLMDEINGLGGVKGCYPFIWGQGVINFNKRAQGIGIRSVDLTNAIDIEKIGRHIYAGMLDLEGNDILIGKELAITLGAFIGDEVELMTSLAAKSRMFKITGIFNSGMYEYDLNLAYMGMDKASEVFGTAGFVNGIGVDLFYPSKAMLVKDMLRNLLPAGFYARTWTELNRNLFAALKLEKIAMFLILTLIIVVAALNIISTLTVMVTDKKKDIGILKAIGATRGMVLGIFSLHGLIIGISGIVLGVLGGLGLIAALDKWRFPVLPESVYYGINYLPVKISTLDCFIVLCAALIISLVASIYPAYRASVLEPVEALRYE